MIRLVPYDPAWRLTFGALRKRLTTALDDLAIAIEHVGSTAVPGLVAKPIIDIDVLVSSDRVGEAIERLGSIGYLHEGNLGIPGREAFRRPRGTPDHHLYVCPQGSREYVRHLRFRDHLRLDAATRRAYAELKLAAARAAGADRDAYTRMKSEFIELALAPTAMNDCVFCAIVSGELPASFVYRDELVSAFLDIRPVSPGHLLVIPNDHVVFTHDVPDSTADRLFEVARHSARSLRSGDAVRADGTNLFVADGEAAEQEVFHAHLHVIPRFPGDGFVIDAAAWREPPPTREALDRQATAIRDGQSEPSELSGNQDRNLALGPATVSGRGCARRGHRLPR